jgi:PAS domain S-box-containing protein
MEEYYHFLVVEDNPGDFVLIEDFIDEKMPGSTIVYARNFKESFQILSRKDHLFNVILLDLSLPDKSGSALIQEMLRLSDDVPIIILTGYVDMSFSVQSLSQGVSDYLVKDELSAMSLYKSILYSIERKRKSLELEESEKRYSDLFHLSPLPMWVFDTDTFRFLSVNGAAIRHYGYTIDEFLAMSVFDVRMEEDIPFLLERILDTKNMKGFYRQGIFRHKKKDGTLIHVDIQTNHILYNGRNAQIVLANDITERVNYIKAIETQNEKLREISRIQSHVVRSPLARIMGLINLINSNSNHDQKLILNHILESAYEFDRIVRDISAKAEQIELNIKDGI